MAEYVYKIIIEPQEEGGYTAYSPKFPGCVSEGETYQETIDNIQEALELYLEVQKERGYATIKDDIHVTELCVNI
jgi:predicted RNase H-like HicB family nuclease